MQVKKEFLPLLEHQYVLIDQGYVGEMHLPETYPVISLAPEEGRKQKQLYPVLLSFSELETKDKKHLLEQMVYEIKEGYPPTLGMFIQAPKIGIKDLADCLKERVVIQDPQHNHYLLRYFDARVLVQLSWMLPETTLQQLAGPIGAWTFYLDNEYHTLETKQPLQPNSSFSNRSVDINQLNDINIINRTLEKINFTGTLDERVETGKQIYAILPQAQQYQITEQDDLVLFATQHQLLPEQFEQHPKMAALLNQVTKQKQSYSQICSDADETYWDTVLTDLKIENENIKGLIYG